MKSVPKLIRRFVGILFISLILLLLLNIIAFIIIGLHQTPSRSPYTVATEVGKSLTLTESGYVLEEEKSKELENDDVWAILIDNDTHSVVWHTENLPDSVPREYTLSDISDLTTGYINGYPTYVGDSENGVVVLGYPTNRFWKLMWPTWDYQFIAHLPQTVLVVFCCNLLLIFLIYIFVTGKLIKSVNPIIDGIKSLTTKNKIRVKEKGVLSELAFNINQAEELLQEQERLLSKRETARANWIAGVSHDIRTPLSMVMGYAAQLECDERLPDEERQKATVIVKQSERMRNLINDLNLASKLEYNMQPVQTEQMNIISAVRQVVVDFINLDIEGKYPIEWLTDENLNVCMLNADKDLIKRAVGNLIQNSINHNENGCGIFVSVSTEQDECKIIVSDNGIGATDEQIEKLNNAPHYMVCDENTSEQRHGLGLLIVKQIVAAHKGTVTIRHSKQNGFEVEMTIPSKQNAQSD